MEIYCDTLAGVKFADSQLTAVQPGQAVQLVHEKSNRFDENAIRVDTLDNVKLGYIKKRDTHILHNAKANGAKFQAFIRSYNPTANSWEQIVVVVYRENTPAEIDKPL